MIVSFNKFSASLPIAIIFDLSNLTFSKEISEHDWPSTVENELIEMNKDFGFLIFFDTLKKSGNSVFLNTVTDSGLLVESSFKNTFKNNTIYIVFTDGNSAKLEGNCGKQIAIINKKNNDVSIKSKLKKLKSLFEDNLITQEEYDIKRKEILDDM